MANMRWRGAWKLAFLAVLFSHGAFAAPTQRAATKREPATSDYSNPMFAYTHLLPSPLTLPAGRLVLGTSAAYGITDSIQIGSDLLRLAYQVYNANMKVNFVDYEDIAVGFNLTVQNFNYKNINSSNPDLSITSWLPGLVVGYAITPKLATFVGGNAEFSNRTPLSPDGLATSGYTQGASGEWDLSWAYNPTKKNGGLGNVLAAGATYDLTYHVYGIGVSHYWRGFRVGIHYYPNATDYKVLPIIAGGAVVDF